MAGQRWAVKHGVTAILSSLVRSSKAAKGKGDGYKHCVGVTFRGCTAVLYPGIF